MRTHGKMAGGPRTSDRALRPIDRLPYLAAAIPLLLLEYAAAFIPGLTQRSLEGAWAFGIGWMAWLGRVEGSLLGLVILLCSAALGWLSLRRTVATGDPGSFVALAVVPWLQLPAILWLALSRSDSSPTAPDSTAAVRGALWGLAIAFGAEILLTLTFGSYGIALFVGSPFIVGLIASYLAQRDGHPRPLMVAQYALVLASAVLFGFALEGLVCLLIAYPLAALAALIGGAFGSGLARMRVSSGTAFSTIALLPLLLAAETAAPPLAEFGDTRSIEVDAPPAAVWQAIVHMGTIHSPPAAPFDWGLAYPVAGHIQGQGVGAVRLGVFSTGTAYERVTRWKPGRELWFDVLSDPPMMRESNPFGPVRAPHLEGYFSTRYARFTLAALPGRRTRLTLATDHTLRIGPTEYFLPLAHWAVRENKRRVLAHFRTEAEARYRAT
ncbi:MAG TPA: hypothetical protein VNB78_06270 [Sphingomicrobium sp.]|nr:hypothetical protein [Sphingomicrobium sp.]